MSEAEVNEKINLIYLNSIADMVEYKFPKTAKYFKEFVVPNKKLIADIKVWMDRLKSDAHLINYTHETLYSTLHTLLFAIGEQ